MRNPDRIEIPPGAEFEIELTAAGGSGYRWEPGEVPTGLVVLNERGATASSSPAHPLSPPSAGEPLSQVFVLRAAVSRREEAEMEFILRRPWEAEPIARHTVHIVIANPRH